MEIFEIFNEKNELIGTAPRSEVHSKGLFHRGVHVFLVNAEGKIFLQKRAENKDVAPGSWDLSCGEHLKPGESYKEAAARGLKEELGIDAEVKELREPKLFRINHENGKIDNDFDALFVAEAEGPFTFQDREVAEGRFFSREEIEQDLKEGKRKFTPFFLLEWPEFKKLY